MPSVLSERQYIYRVGSDLLPLVWTCGAGENEGGLTEDKGTFRS